MLSQESAVGNYFKDDGQEILQISHMQRKSMIVLIEEIANLKCYKLETLYAAVAIADHYLAYLIPLNEVSPCLVQLGTTCLWIASKLEESAGARIGCVIQYISNKFNVKLLP